MADDGRRHFDQGMCWRRKGSSMKREKEEGGGGRNGALVAAIEVETH